MKIKLLSFSLALIAMFMVAISACNKEDAPLITESEQVSVQIDFTTPISAAEVAGLIDGYDDIEVFQAQHKMHMEAGIVVTGMVGISNNDFEAYLQNLPENVDAFQGDVASNKEYTRDLRAERNGQPVQSIELVQDAITNYELSDGDAHISAIVGIVDKDAQLKRFKDSKFYEVKIHDYQPLKENENSSNENGISRSNTVPFLGFYSANPSSAGGNQRFVLNYFAWDENNFGGNHGYEHDFIMNNSSNSSLGPGVYLDPSQNSLGFPSVNYAAAANMPSPYLDTRFQDPSYLKAFTIGSAHADQIEEMVWSITYIRADEGNASNDNADIIAQRSKGIPWGCANVTCLFSDNLTDLNTASCSSSYCTTLPGAKVWQYPE